MDKICPNCGEKYKWYETECPDCRVALVEAPPSDSPDPDITLVSVFQTDELGLLPLVTMTLEQAGIEFVERDVQGTPALEGGRSVRGDVPHTPVEILVASDAAARARELLDDLGSERTTLPPLSAVPSSHVIPSVNASVDLIDTESGRSVGRITETQLDWLTAQLEKESPDDRDFYVDRATLDMLQEAGADPDLVLLLRTALGGRDGLELGWSRDE